MMTDLVQWRQVPLTETKLATPSRPPLKNLNNIKNLTTHIDFLAKFYLKVRHTRSANNLKNVHKI